MWPSADALPLTAPQRNALRRLELHLIVDNYSTHKHEQVKKWLAKHPRFHFHFIPTSSSWLNLVRGGNTASVPEWPYGQALFCCVRRGWRTTPLPANSASTARPSSCGESASPSPASTDSAIGRAPDANRRSPLNSSNASSIQRFTRSPGRPRIGAPAPSPSTWASPRWPSSASGKRTDCSPIASKLSSSAATSSSSRNSAID